MAVAFAWRAGGGGDGAGDGGSVALNHFAPRMLTDHLNRHTTLRTATPFSQRVTERAGSSAVTAQAELTTARGLTAARPWSSHLVRRLRDKAACLHHQIHGAKVFTTPGWKRYNHHSPVHGSGAGQTSYSHMELAENQLYRSATDAAVDVKITSHNSTLLLPPL